MLERRIDDLVEDLMQRLRARVCFETSLLTDNCLEESYQDEVTHLRVTQLTRVYMTNRK